MWNNSQWEQENQELLKEWYLDKVTGKAPDSAVRKIHREGCGGIFYTRIHSKAHIHTHIEFNSTNLNCDGKFVNL